MAQPMMTPMPTDEQIWGIFQKATRDAEGRIAAKDLPSALTGGPWVCGATFDDATCRMMVDMFDQDKKGTMQFEDFAVLWRCLIEWQNCFQLVAKGGTTVDRYRLQCALQTLGYRLPPETVATLVSRYENAYTPGSVTVAGFIKCCVLLNNVTAAFRRLDADGDGLVTIDFHQFVTLVFSLGM